MPKNYDVANKLCVALKNHSGPNALVYTFEKILGEEYPQMSGSMLAFGSPDTFASYCINLARKRGCTEWLVAWELWREAVAQSLPQLHAEGDK